MNFKLRHNISYDSVSNKMKSAKVFKMVTDQNMTTIEILIDVAQRLNSNSYPKSKMEYRNLISLQK